MTDVRTVRRADELKVGDWLAASMAEDDVPNEVVALVPYSTVENGPFIEITYRQPNGGLGHWPVLPEAVLTLATAAEVAAQQESAGRARVAAEFVRLADLVLKHQLPVTVAGNTPTVAFPLGRDVAAVERVAAVLRRKVDRIGRNVSVWLSEPDELPVGVYWSAFEPKDAEPAPDPDPTGQLYSREADDSTPPGAREPLHTGGVVDGGQLVDETPEESAAIVDQNLRAMGSAGLAANTVPVAAEDATLTRLPEAEDETPVNLMDQTGPCVASLHIPAPGVACGICGAEGMRSAQHVQVDGTASSDGCEAECACGAVFAGDTPAEVRELLTRHVRQARSGAPSAKDLYA